MPIRGVADARRKEQQCPCHAHRVSCRRVKSAVLLLAVLAACPGPRGPDADRGSRLVVLVIIDQWPEWSFEVKRPELPQGFGRLLAEGEWHVGHHPSAATLTAPGHALLGTGEASVHSGILANEW